METALQLSFYVFGAVFALGVLMVLVLIKDVFFHGRFSTVLPGVKRVPNTALDAARSTLQRLQEALQRSQGELHDSIAYEMRHLEHRIAALEDKAYTDQSNYYEAVKARERTWRQWRERYQESSRMGFLKRRRLRDRLEELRGEYRTRNREVDEEYQRAVARDALSLEELRASGALDPEVLRPAPPAAGTGTAAGEAAQPAPGAVPARLAANRRGGQWITRLPPYPPAEGGLLAQADLARPDVQKSERTYVEPTFSTAALPGGVLAGADLSRSSLAEVEFVGPQRFARCSLVGTDLRRIEMRLADGPHIFQDCDLRGASLAQAQLSGVVFRRCNLAGTHWRNAHLDRVKFEACDMDNVRWEGVDLSRTMMSEDMLEQADFAFASKPPLNLRPAMESPPELAGQAQPAAPAQPGPGPAAPPQPAGAPQPAEGQPAPEAPEEANGTAPAPPEATDPAPEPAAEPAAEPATEPANGRAPAPGSEPPAGQPAPDRREE
jgi:uncharacterized protein YjbI with pentapeptide repeats